jgi:DNA repair protein RadC
MRIYKSFAHKITLVKEKSNYDFFKCQLQSSKDSANFARQFYNDDLGIYESFFVICLNVKCNTISYAKIGQGGLSATYVDPILIAKFAIESLAKSVILVHNHPSGGLEPSKNDIELTKTIRDGLGLFKIDVLDHIIVTETDYFSFADNGSL